MRVGRCYPLTIVVLLLSMSVACREEHKVSVAKDLNPQQIPTMVTHNVSTLISDSGVTQYKIVSPVWYVYDETETPRWKFPKGLYLRKFDPLFRTVASVACDSATYLKHNMLWKLDGNVEIKRMPSDIILTQQMFWNQREHTIYSDSFVHIETDSRIIEGYGFLSNENLTSYRIIKPTGIFPVDRSKLGSQASQNPSSGAAVPASSRNLPHPGASPLSK